MLLTTLGVAQTMLPNAVPIRQGVNIEWSRATATDSDGGIVYVWSDTKLGARDLFAMKFDETGNSVWGNEPTIIDNKIDRQEDPVIIRTSDDGFVIAWIDFSLDQDGDVFAQKISSSGEILWQEGGVPVCTFQDIQISLNIVENSVGGAYILWKDSRNPSIDLYAVNLDGDGNNLWTENGMPIANTNYPETSNSMREDGTGGFFFGYQVQINNNANIFAKRFNSAGESVWGDPIPVAVANGDQSTVRVSPDGNGDYVFVWEDKREETSNIFAQKLSSEGTALWGDYIEVYSDEDDDQSYGQSYPQVQSDGMGNTIIAWQDTRSAFDNVGVFIQKINSDGEKVWEVDGVEVRANQVRELTLRIDSDNNGGAYVIWTDMRNGDFPNVDIYAQHLNSDGTFQWADDGLAICTAPNEQNSPLIKKIGDHIFTVWLDARTGSIGINQQIIDSSSNFVLAENGETVFYGLSGDAGKDNLMEAYPRPMQDDAVVVWLDTRGASNGYQIFFQYINLDGSVDLEENGRPVTVPTGYEITDFRAAANDEGQTIVVWLEQRGYYKKIFAQLIDVDGNYLWGDEGLEMTTAYTAGQEDPRVSYYNGDFYLGWTDNMMTEDGIFIKQVFGQKVSNGERQWGDEGLQISGSTTGELTTEMQLHDVIGNYYIWNVFQTDRRIVKVDDNGQVLDSYSVEGNSIASSDVIVDFGGKGTIHDNTLYYSWIDNSVDGLNSVFTQGFNTDGTYAWQEGISTSLQDYDGSLNEALNPDIATGDAVYVTWNESITSDNENIKAQKISFTGENQFADEGIMIGEGNISQNNPTIARINNGYYAIAWEQQEGVELDLYLNLLRYNGETLNGSTGIPLTTELKDQKSVRIVPMGDSKAFFVWADGVSSGKTVILGVYAQYVDFSPVSNEENNNAQVVTSALDQNYPNPFNPTTNISFNLTKDVKDVELSIYNLKGQKVKTIVKDDFSKGSYSYVWNGDNDQDNSVASGIYFYKLKAGKQTSTKKMVLMK
jgi:hypothetical protein